MPGPEDITMADGEPAAIQCVKLACNMLHGPCTAPVVTMDRMQFLVFPVEHPWIRGCQIRRTAQMSPSCENS